MSKKKLCIISGSILVLLVISIGVRYYFYAQEIENEYKSKFGETTTQKIEDYLQKKVILVKSNDIQGVIALNKTLTSEEQKTLRQYLVFDEERVEREKNNHFILYKIYSLFHK